MYISFSYQTLQSNLTVTSLLIAQRQEKIICHKKLAYKAKHTSKKRTKFLTLTQPYSVELHKITVRTKHSKTKLRLWNGNFNNTHSKIHTQCLIHRSDSEV